jgi:hypothetical protein
MAKMISYPTDPTQMERIIEAGSAEARELDNARRDAFRPERVSITPEQRELDATGWVINDITIGNISQFVNDPRRKIARSLRIAAKRLELAPNHRRALRDQADRLLGLLPMARGDVNRRRRRAERVLAGGAMDFEI